MRLNTEYYVGIFDRNTVKIVLATLSQVDQQGYYILQSGSKTYHVKKPIYDESRELLVDKLKAHVLSNKEQRVKRLNYELASIERLKLKAESECANLLKQLEL